MDSHRAGTHNISTSPSSLRFNAPPSLYPPSKMSSGGSGVLSPPDSRRTSSEEQHPPTQARQTLPSLPRLHEALEGVNALKYPPGAPPPPPPSSQHVSTSSFFPPPSAVATSDSSRRPFEPQPAYGDVKPSYSSHSTPTMAQHPSPRSNSFPGPSGYSSQPHKAPPVPPIRTGGSPNSSARRPSYQSSHPPTPFEPSPQSAPASSTYSGYSYQSAYSYPPNTPTGQDHPPAVMSGPAQFSASYRGDRERASNEGKPNTPYGESVKRRLDHFQFQSSLCDVSILLDLADVTNTLRSSSKPRLNCKSMPNSGNDGPTKPRDRSAFPSRSCRRKKSRTSSPESRC